MPSPDTLIFHIGIPKTGTSLIQKAMRRLRPRLRSRGVAYLDRGQITELAGFGAWLEDPTNLAAQGGFLGEVAELAGRAVGPDQTTLLVSNEGAAGHSRTFDTPFWPRARPAVTSLIEAIAPARTQLVVYVRRQDRLLESLYMERIHRGNVVEWPDFRDRVCGDDRVRYGELIDQIIDIPTVTEIRVRPFEIIGAGAAAFVADFLDGIGQSELTADIPARILAVSNPSYTDPAWRAALAVNSLLETNEQRTNFRRFIRTLFPADSYPEAPLLNEDERLDLLARYRSHNERLFAEYLPEFPMDAYSTLDGVDRLKDHLNPIDLPDEPEPGSDKPHRSLPSRIRTATRAAWREVRHR